MVPEPERVTITTRAQWRKWLEKHHAAKDRVALVLYKRHTGKSAPTHRECLEEAICFGWIDTTIKRLDEDRFIRTFARRRVNGKWSTNTMSYAKDLIKRQLMAPAGLAAYKRGLQQPIHDSDALKDPDPPEELIKALSKHKKAFAFFTSLAPSYRRIYVIMVLTAKRDETRKKRIKDVVQRCKEQRKPGL